MKKFTTLMLISLMTYCTVSLGQTRQNTDEGPAITKPKKVDTLKQMNLLDEQTKIYGQLFELAETGEENPLVGATNYLELLNQMSLSEEQRELLYGQYKIYDLSLDPSKKDSLSMMVEKMMSKALEINRKD